MLLSGMMAFLFTIFALIATDTSQAIYNRIVAQNSVDAAADAAALWQARGCNMLQNLNNYHYDANNFFAQTETTALQACLLGSVLNAVKDLSIPYVSQAAAVLAWGVCNVCHTAPYWDNAQAATASAILAEQELITKTIPAIAFVAANDAAQGSGADDLIKSATAYGSQMIAPIPVLQNLSGTLTSMGSTVSKILSYFNITVYALPLDISSLGLGVQPQSGTASPWKFPPCQALILSGKLPLIGCGLDDPTLDWGPEKQYSEWYGENWGWYDDQYYVGQPGFMTWIAGKTNQPTVLGFLRWLNPNPNPPPEVAYWMNQNNLPMYQGSATGSSGLEIPAFIAIASSQVDGAPGTTWSGVVEKGPANAYPYLIPVYFPFGGGPGKSIGVFH